MARALSSLAEVHEVSGDHEAATIAQAQANEILTGLETPGTDAPADRLRSVSTR
jgi:hypothetical protein